MHHLLLKKITKTLGLGWFGVVYSWSLCILATTQCACADFVDFAKQRNGGGGREKDL
jgi:hypothetical protein